MGIFVRNLHLAEDRILCFELVAKIGIQLMSKLQKQRRIPQSAWSTLSVQDTLYVPMNITTFSHCLNLCSRQTLQECYSLTD